SAGELLGVRRVDGDVGLALRTALVRDVDVAAVGDRRGRAAAGDGAVVLDELVLLPPRGIVLVVRLRPAGGRDEHDQERELTHKELFLSRGSSARPLPCRVIA